jgi:hypothetical protein
MATTTNYGWTTPDDTSLVKDGAAAIRTLGSSVDTTTKALNPSTTLGDIEYRSSTANTNTRLGIGTTGQILTVSGGVPSWASLAAGGMTLISTTAMTGASITLSSIPQTYKNLNLIIRNPLPATDNVILSMRFNGDSGNNYAYADTTNTTDQSDPHSGCILHIGQDNAVAEGMLDVRISDYTNAVSVKTVNSLSVVNNATNTGNWNITGYNCVWDNTAAITSITLHYQSGNITSGSVLLYGVA